MRILAIDPGYERMGVAIIELSTKGNELLYSDCIRTNPKDTFSVRLLAIGNEIERLITEYTPTVLATEELYFNTNQKTGIKVAEVRGVIIFLSQKHNLSYYQYSPLQIKNAVTGYGKSTKHQVAKMVPQLIVMHKPNALDDEYDAVAIGLTCAASERFTVG